MKEFKKIKDPIYGYINIPIEYIKNVIDCPEFQRLRRISQTSYASLYPSSTHNRFAHSLGVFYLGNIACKHLKKEIEKLNILKIAKLDELCKTFVLACLLHDVGHAPFSHTGEAFYLNEENEPTDLHNKLKSLISTASFKNDIPTQKSASAAPHEIMSAIIGLKTFGYLLQKDWQKEFFARCITGYMYSKDDKENDIKNCFIGLLNSKVIDVDRLDYLIRDAFFAGFNNVNIDYERLLSSLTVIERNKKDEKNNTIPKYELAFFKDAISIIENVVYAHDCERKWIQTHPSVLYESYLLQGIMTELSDHFREQKEKLFSVEALGKEGIPFKDHKISFLCDDDIIYLMKNMINGKFGNEYFNRNARRHPIWKSEPEYKAFVSSAVGKGEILDKIKESLENMVNYLTGNSNTWIINKELVEAIDQEIQKIEADSQLDEFTKKIQLKEKRAILNLANFLLNYAGSACLSDCDFIVLKASQFSSGFSKPDFSSINIVFKGGENPNYKKFGDVASPLSSSKAEDKDFFYLFYKRNNSSEDINKNEFCNKLFLNQMDYLSKS